MMDEDWHTHAQHQYVTLNDAKNDMFHLCHMKGHEARIIFQPQTWHQTLLVFMLLPLKKATAKIYFLHYDIWVTALYTTFYVL